MINSHLNELAPHIAQEVKKLDKQDQQHFFYEYNTSKKKYDTGFILALIGFHYAYLNKWGLQVLLTITCLMYVGLIWWIFTLINHKKDIKQHNNHTAQTILNNIKLFK